MSKSVEYSAQDSKQYYNTGWVEGTVSGDRAITARGMACPKVLQAIALTESSAD